MLPGIKAKNHLYLNASTGLTLEALYERKKTVRRTTKDVIKKLLQKPTSLLRSFMQNYVATSV